MKNLSETAVSIALALGVLLVVYSFYGAQLTSMVTKAFDSVPK